MNEHEMMQKQLLEQFDLLSVGMQKAICWLLENLDFVHQIPDSPMTFSEKERYVAEAKQHGDDLLVVLLEYKWLEQKYRKEKECDI